MPVRRRRFKQPTTLIERLTDRARIFRHEADALPEGAEKSEMLDKAKQCDAAALLDGWLRSGELVTPR